VSRVSEIYIDQILEEENREEMERSATCEFSPVPPMPIPTRADDTDLTTNSYSMDGKWIIESVIAENRDWLQFEARTTTQVLETLFPRTTTQHISLDMMLIRIAGVLFAAGYTPNDHSHNPTWVIHE
jgi:hypothetical protein